MKLFVQAFSTTVISVIIALFVNFMNPKGIPLIGDYSKEAMLRELEAKKQELIRSSKEKMPLNDVEAERLESELESDISLVEAYEYFKRGDAIFIDARDEEEYKTGHIKGAINLPAERVEDYVNLLDEIPKEMKIVTYCGGSDCNLSIELANYLVERGYFDVKIFFGGWIDWQDAGYPIEGP